MSDLGALEKMRQHLEEALEKASPEDLGPIMGQLGRVNLELGDQQEALISLMAAHILLVAKGQAQAPTVEGWLYNLRQDMGEERFMDAFHKALPQAGFLLVRYLGRREAEAAMEEFARIKGGK